jgi:large subunit ribosomal protein L4
LVVTTRAESVEQLSVRNLPGVHWLAPDQLNTYDVMVSDDLVFTAAGLAEFLASPKSGLEPEEAAAAAPVLEKAKKTKKADKTKKAAAAKAEPLAGDSPAEPEAADAELAVEDTGDQTASVDEAGAAAVETAAEPVEEADEEEAA